MSHFNRTLLLASACGLLAAACSEGGSSGPSGPDVSGLWTGTWRGASISLDLDQAGAELSGTVVNGVEDLSVTGAVSAEGAVTWGSAVHPTRCAFYSTALGGMQLRAAGDSLVGVVQRRSGSRVCDPESGTRVFVEQGDMRLSRVSS